jgi:hypothetical protein
MSPVPSKFNFESFHSQAKEILRNVYDFIEGVTSEYFGIPGSKLYKLKEGTY